MYPFQFLATLLLAISFSNGQSPLSLVVEPEDTVAGYTGSILSATLRCQGSPEDSVINWYKDDRQITNTTTEPNVTVTEGGTQLTVSSYSDNGDFVEGYYFCEVRGVGGKIRSRWAWIKRQQQISFMHVEAHKALSTVEDVVVVQKGYLNYPVEESLTLWTVKCGMQMVTCTVVDCVFWQHISPAGPLLIQSALYFGYSDIQRAFSRCETNDEITVTSFDQKHKFKFSYVNGAFNPRPTIKSQEVSLKVGETAILYCLSSDPDSVFKWNKDGSVLKTNNLRFSFINGSVLQITGVTKSDTGKYECTYTFPNIASGITKSSLFELTVYSLPTASLTLTETSPSRNLTECNSTATQCDLMQSNSSLIIDCMAEGSTPVFVQLVNNGVLLSNKTSQVSHADDSPQSGIYQCVASNKYGSHQTSVYVNAITRPSPTVVTSPPVATSSPVTTSSTVLVPTGSDSANGPISVDQTTPSVRPTVLPQSSSEQPGSSTPWPGTVATQPISEDESSIDIAVIAGAAAGGVIVLLLLLILIVCCIRKRKKGVGHVADNTGKKTGNGTGNAPSASITLYANLSTDNTSKSTQPRPQYYNFSENVTSFGIPVPAADREGKPPETKRHKYNTLDHNPPVSDNIPVSTGTGVSPRYSVLKRDDSTSNINQENEYARVLNRKDPFSNEDTAENNYAVAAPHADTKPASSMNTKMEYCEPQDQLFPPETQLSNLNTDITNGTEDDLYTEPANTKSRKIKKRPVPRPRSAVKSNEEYAYACPPDAVRLPSIEPDHITVGDSGDEYAISLKNTLKPSASRDTPEEELYAVVSDEHAATRVPVYSNDVVQKSTGEDEYAVTVKRRGKTEASMSEGSDNDQSNSSMTPEHYELGDDWYAVSAKPSAKRMVDQTRRKSPLTEYGNHSPENGSYNLTPSGEDSEYATVANS